MTKQILLAAVGTICLSPCFADGAHVPLTIPKTPLSGTDHPHSPSMYFAQGHFDLQSNVLSLSFFESVGVCTITVTNTMGELYMDVFDSDCGLFQMILSGEPGLYIVSIQTGTGAVYSGQFMVF